MRGARVMMREIYTERGLCDCCDMMLLRTIEISCSVITMIAGAVIVGMGLVMRGTEVFLPEKLAEYQPELGRLSVAMPIIGGMVAAMCIVGCVATVKHSNWLIITYILLHILTMAAQISCGILTLFLRNEIRTWAYGQEDCEDCVDICKKVLELPTIVASIMLGTILIQLCLVFAAFRVSRMKSQDKEERTLYEMMSEIPSKLSNVTTVDYNSNVKGDVIEKEPIQVHFSAPDMRETLTPSSDDMTSPCKATPRRMSTSPAKLPSSLSQGAQKVGAYVHSAEYATIPEESL